VGGEGGEGAPHDEEAMPKQAQASNLAAVRERLEENAARGDVSAMVSLGRLLAEHWDPPDLGSARAWWERAAAIGNTDAMYNLGSLLSDRWDPPDLPTARTWYEKAAAAGDVSAMHSLGGLLAQRPADLPAARAWLEKAAAAGDVEAMVTLGSVLTVQWDPPDLAAAWAWLEKAASAGNAVAMYNLGQMLALRSDPPDLVGARTWWERAAVGGDVPAMYNLGLLLADRWDPPDLRAARTWWEKAAAAGDVDSMHNLGILLTTRWSPPDLAAAYEWHQRAAATGHPGAMYDLSALLARSNPPDLRSARAWLQRAAHAGHLEAMATLGAVLAQWNPPDLIAARAWLEKAAAAGHGTAKANLALMLNISPQAPEGDATSARKFRDDDAGYLTWLAAHPDGYVINIERSHSGAEARVHHAGCWTISGQSRVGVALTGPYVKYCAEHLAELDQWAISNVGEPIRRCGTCHPASDVVKPSSTKQTEQAVAPAEPKGRCEIHGPEDSAVVEAWADDYVRFEHRPPWQEQLRSEIRSRCQQLEPSAEQVLHATFFGAKHPNADVENVLLYYIDSFRIAGRNGIRFEHGAGVPPAPDGVEYRFCYRYAMAPRSGTFTHWQQGRTLASFGWTDLGAFAGDKKLAQVWQALKRAQYRREVTVFEPAAPETPFAVRVQLRPPHGHQPVWGGLVKGIFDGVICAFQAHTDTTDLPEVVARLATMLSADPAEIEAWLLDQRFAVLGAAPRLVSPYQAGVKWDPSDHLCVAGELLAAEPVDSRWAIKGEIFELSR
jgi:TPR repeat protein